MSSFLRPRRNGSQSRRQERRLAKELGGRTTPGSGSGSIKGDVHTRGEMVEAKTTAKSQYTLKLVDLKKLENEARLANKRPVFVIQIEDTSSVFLFHNEWVLIPKQDYLALKEASDGRTDG